MKAVILAAGEGTRLRPLTIENPKCLVEVSGVPMIDHIFDSLPEEIDEVVIVVDYLKEKIESYLGETYRRKRVHYVEQGEKKGTFGALLSAKHLIEEGERFLVLHGDDIHDKKELEECLKHARAMGVQKKVMPNYYNIVLTEDGYIEDFKPQTEEEKKSGVLIATGAYMLDSHIFDHEGTVGVGGEYILPRSIFEQRAEYPIKAVVTDAWLPINSLQDMETADMILANGKRD